MSRNVVVTGGGTGIGRAVAARFAEAGDAVLVIGRRRDVLERAAKELGPAIRPMVCDLADPDAVEALVAGMPERIDVLVNNAGSRETAASGTGLSGTAARWRSDFERNVLTTVLLTEALRDRLAADGGRVVTLSSSAAVRGAGSYGAAKAALHAWNRHLAAQLGPSGITANIVAPGTVAGTEFFGERLTEAEVTRRAGRTLVGRVGVPDEIAGTVVFLASAEAGYITGEVLHADGGELIRR
ncbi:oxidoreductase [Mangrovactinospora gilvigrisea]|uniref:Oxidoreductase n=1 Tax=Mangrovactinospora gilvigrisea TaxID=1428644 RepID=A0A1J7BFS4_9ACTN|nr:SDR family oxidoreductase [Mangrovactinospora gilvigrisea]OIV37502.1 oxidoreductase [Mangrovactinospora gilvigrisea]